MDRLETAILIFLSGLAGFLIWLYVAVNRITIPDYFEYAGLIVFFIMFAILMYQALFYPNEKLHPPPS